MLEGPMARGHLGGGYLSTIHIEVRSAGCDVSPDGCTRSWTITPAPRQGTGIPAPTSRGIAMIILDGTLGNVVKHSSVSDTNSSDVTIADKFIRNLEEYAQEGDIVVCAVADQAASSSTDGDRAWKAS